MENSKRENYLPNVNLINQSYAALIALVQHSCKASDSTIAQMLMPMLNML